MLQSAPTTSELAAIVDALRASNAIKVEKLKELKGGNVKTISKEEVQRIEKGWEYWGAKKKARKGAYRNVEDQLAEGMERRDIREKAGIEDADSEWLEL